MKQEIDYHTTSLEMILLKTFSPVFCRKTIAYPPKMSTFAASNEKYDIKTKWCIRLEV